MYRVIHCTREYQTIPSKYIIQAAECILKVRFAKKSHYLHIHVHA